MIRLRLLGFKGFYVLQNILEYKDYISDVVIGEDKAVIDDYSNDIQDFCLKYNIPFSFRTAELPGKSYYTVAIGWRWIVSKEKLIVFHDSLLPRYRGFNPLVTALINGDDKVGVTSLFGVDDYDAGAIIGQYQISITYPIKINALISKISPLYLQLLKDILEQLKQGKQILCTAQDISKISYSIWRNDEDYFIDWTESASTISRMIDAVGYPYAGARTRLKDTVFIIQDAIEVPDVIIENRTPGKVIFKDNDGLTIICGQGLLKIKNFYTLDENIFDYQKLFRLKFS